MSNPRYGALLAVAGLAIVAFGLGTYASALFHTDERIDQRSRPGSTAAGNEQLSAQSAIEARLAKACEPRLDDRGSDLCAQWKAADAAHRTAWWALISTLIAGLGTIGLYWQIRLTRKAIVDGAEAIDLTKASADAAMRNADSAAEQVRLTREAMIQTERAYVTQTALISNRTVFQGTEIPAYLHFSVEWSNTGNTPATNASTHINISVRNESIPDDFDFPNFGHIGLDQRASIGPKAKAKSADVDVEGNIILPMINGEAFVYIWGWYEYDDVFEGTPRHRTEFAFRLLVNEFSLNDGPIRFHEVVLPRHNGVDSWCMYDPISS